LKHLALILWWMEGNRSALAAYIRAGIDGPRKQRRVFRNRLQECFPCRSLIAAQRKQARLIEEFARENGWNVKIHDFGISVTFQAVASESQAVSDMTLRSNEFAHDSGPTIAQSALAKKGGREFIRGDVTAVL